MQRRLLICAALCLAVLMAACQGPPPTMIVLVVTATAETAAVSGSPTTTGELPTPTTAVVPPTSTPAATPTIDPFPTPTVAQVQVAEQVFERGRMFWVQPRREIWLLVETSANQGRWTIYRDDFQEGEMEVDPSIIAPTGMYQPERGFGKLWREATDVREALGWGMTPEFGYVSNYEYHPGGTVTDGRYAPAPGHHILTSLYGERFQFNEADGTWQKQ